MRLTSLNPTGCAHATLIAGALFGIAVQTAAQQTPRPSDSRVSWVHESWTVQNGLPVNSITGLLQGRDGYIWASTFDGLVRFDGARFVVFNSANSTGLPSNRIVTVREGRDSTLWLVTEQSHLVRFRRGQFSVVRPDSTLGDAVIATVFEDSTGVVWVATDRGLGRARGDRLEAVVPSVLSAPVLTVSQRIRGGVWVATLGAGVFSVEGDRVSRITLEGPIESDTLSVIHEDADGTLWLGGAHGLWAGREAHRRIAASGKPVTSIQQLVHATGRTHVATTASGVFRIESGSATLIGERPARGVLWTDGSSTWHSSGVELLRDGRREFALASSTSEPLTPNAITQAVVDREGSIWLGTHAGGLHRLKQGLFTTYSVAEGLSYRNVYTTYEDRRGAIWVGSWGKGVTRIDATGVATFNADHGVPAIVNSLYEDPQGGLWIGGADGLRVCSQPNVASLSCSRTGTAELQRTLVLALHGDADGRIWAGSWAGLHRFDGRSWTLLPRASGAPTAPVRAFAETRDGALWMATNGAGLARYREGRFSAVTTADGLPSDLVRAIYQDADGFLWVGTEGRGLARLDPGAWSGEARGNRRIVRVGTRDGLFDEVIHQILEDDAGRLWMSTNRGIFWVTRAELNAFADGKVTRVHATGYSERDGLRNREANGGVYPAGVRSRDGRLWFPTQDGVAVIDPARVRPQQTVPPVLVEQVIARGEPVASDTSGGVSLTPVQRDFQVEYTALTYLEPSNVRFRYRLEGYDADWVDAGNRRTAFYTQVRPRAYTFRVQASNAGGEWYEPGAALELRVIPRIYETTWFRWLSAAALAVVAIGGVRWRGLRLRRRAIALERLVDERTVELRERERELATRNRQLEEQAVQLHALDHAKTRFFANVSHELRTPLTLTIGPLQDLRERSGGDPKVERWLDIALRNSRRLLRLVNQILDVAKLDAGQMRLEPRPIDLAPFTRGIVAAFAPVAEQKGIDLGIRVPDSLGAVIDTDAMEKVLTNLLSNAIKFTPAGGSVLVAWSREEDHTARLLVRDTGPGIPADQLPRVFERFYQVDETSGRAQPGTGIGLALVKELVELQGGRVDVESSSAGSAFTVMVPLGSKDTRVAEAQPAGTSAEPAPALVVTGEEGGPQPESVTSDSLEDVDRNDVPTLLVVDDSDDLRGWIRDHFVGRFNVLEAANGAQGIELAQRHLPDVVLSDVMMPVADGHALVRELRASPETDFVPIILLTAQAEDEQKIAGLERGADDYVVKPFEMRELDVRIRNLIESRRRWRVHLSSAATKPGESPPPYEVSELAPADRAFLDRIHAAVRERLDDPDFGVSELADAVAHDRSHLFRRLRQLVGETPSEVIRRVRLDMAAEHLRQNAGTVADVAYAVGFKSVSHFSRAFQEQFGVRPAAYRRRPEE